MAKVSIIVPVYDIEAYLRRCVDSLIAQTLNDIEIILVDDGSTDSSGKICDEYADKDGRIRVIHKANGGLSDARNAGLDAAEGDFIGFADGDDWARPEMFEALYRACDENKTLISACDRAYRMKEMAPDLSDALSKCRVLTSGEFFGKVLRYGDTVSMGVWNKLYSKRIFEDVRFPAGKMHEDNAVLYRLIFQVDRVAYIPVQYYMYEKRPGSITLQKYGKKEYDRYEADHAIYCYLSAKHPDLLSTVYEYLCVSDLYIARSMALSDVHDHSMYKRIKDEVELLLPESERTGLLSRKDDLELKIMCLGYLPYHAFIRLRQAKRRLCSKFFHSDKI